MTEPARTPNRLKGFVAVLVSALCFAAATVAVKFLAQFGMPPLTIAFGRFALGALALSLWFLLRRRHWPRATAPRYAIGRAVANLVAVVLFYEAIARTTVTNANILNLTYPIFVALLSPWLLGEPSGLRRYLAIGAGFLGIWLIVQPDFAGGANLGDLLGLACGIVSAFAVMVLRKAREHDDAMTVVWYVMAVGCVALLPAGVWAWRHAAPHHVGIWFVSSVLGVAGQLAITVGYRHLSAVDGSVASSARILFAAAFGSMFFQEPMTVAVVVGALAILVAITLIATDRRTPAATAAGSG